MTDAFTLSRDSAGIGEKTEIDTRSLNTALGVLAIRVGSAFNSLAFNLRIPLQSLWTEAHRAVVSHSAFCRWSAAGGFEQAGVLTFSC